MATLRGAGEQAERFDRTVRHDMLMHRTSRALPHLAVSSAVVFGAAFAVASSGAWAHASEQALALLLPTDVYIGVGTALVALTAALLYLVQAAPLKRWFEPVTFARRESTAEARISRVSLSATLVLFLLLLAGVAGSRDPLRNPLPLAVWTMFWIGMPVLHALFGDLWRIGNPWSGLLRLICRRGADAPGRIRLPSVLSSWPAVVLLVGVSAFVLADPAPADPDRLAIIVLSYWSCTLALMWLFGEREWLERGEAFALLFRRFAALSPLRLQARKIELGMPGYRLVHDDTPTMAAAISFLILLGFGSFDGLHETFRWLALLDVNPLAYPGRTALIGRTLTGLAGVLLAVILLFYSATAVGARLARSAVHGSSSTAGATSTFASNGALVFRALAPSVLPIAVGYHIAHYLTSFLVDAQYVLIVASDPLDRGIDLFGTAQTHVTTGFFNTPATVRTIWFVQAAAVVIGHVLAVLIAHARTQALFESDAARESLSRRTHLPLVLLMLGYTLFGLWLLAAPRGA